MDRRKKGGGTIKAIEHSITPKGGEILEIAEKAGVGKLITL